MVKKLNLASSLRLLHLVSFQSWKLDAVVTGQDGREDAFLQSIKKKKKNMIGIILNIVVFFFNNTKFWNENCYQEWKTLQSIKKTKNKTLYH